MNYFGGIKMNNNINNNKLIDERQTMINHKVGRNGFIAIALYLLGLFVYDLLVLKDNYIIIYVILFASLTLTLLIVIYASVTKKSKMSYTLNLKYFKTDEMEQMRVDKVLSVTSIFLIISSVIHLLINVYMDIPQLYQDLDFYLIGVFGFAIVISSVIYKDIQLPKNINNINEFYDNRLVRLSVYAKDAFKSTIIWSVISYVVLKKLTPNYTSNAMLNIVLSLTLRFLVFFILDTIFGEINVKKALDLEEKFEE